MMLNKIMNTDIGFIQPAIENVTFENITDERIAVSMTSYFISPISIGAMGRKYVPFILNLATLTETSIYSYVKIPDKKTCVMIFKYKKNDASYHPRI